MKRTICIILAMVMLLSVLVGCSKEKDTTGDLLTSHSESKEDTSRNTTTSVETAENSTTKANISENTTTSGKTTGNSTIKNDLNSSNESKQGGSTTSNTRVNSKYVHNNSQISKPSPSTSPSYSTTTSTNKTPVPSNSSTANNLSSNFSKPEGDYVYRNPTIFVDGMYTLGNVNKTGLRMGDVYANPDIVSKTQIYYNYTMQKIVGFDTNSIVTNVNRMPSNYKLYTYVIDTIPNWLYEKNITSETHIYPAEFYPIAYESYSQYAEYITMFYDAVGNIDYKNVTTSDMHDNILYAVYHPYDDPVNMDKLKAYVDYLKTNGIKLSTVAEPLLPIAFHEGDYVFVRTKVTVNVESAKTNNIKLFLHDNLTLKNGETVFYIDVPLALDDFYGDSKHASVYIGYNIIVDGGEVIGNEELSKYIIG